MTRKKAEPTTPKSQQLQVKGQPGESHEYLLARVAASPHASAATTVTRYSEADWGELDLTTLVDVLKEQANTIKDGDLSNIEAMLASQATALNVMFAELARRAAINMGEYMGAAETYLKLALRAQSQCRATLETLAAIKNPPIVFAKQANIAQGHQQVNNGNFETSTRPPAHARETENQPNKLLEHDHGEWLDTGATATAGGSDPAMEAVGAIYRPS